MNQNKNSFLEVFKRGKRGILAGIYVFVSFTVAQFMFKNGAASNLDAPVPISLMMGAGALVGLCITTLSFWRARIR